MNWTRRNSARKLSQSKQYFTSIGLICATAAVFYFFVPYIGYLVVAFVLLMAVSLLAVLFDILPVLTAAVLSALIWNFFFIPPLYTFHIGTPENALMFMMYFVVAFINAVLTYKIRQVELMARDKEEKEKLISLYKTIFNSVSHELRTPIATIIGAVDTIKGNAPYLTDENKNVLLSEIDLAASRLNSQVSNLLSRSRLESGILKPNLDWCDMNELVYTVINRNFSAASRHRVRFAADDNLPPFKTDGGFVDQILQNIIQNAIQHTPENTVIDIQLTITNNVCALVITDNGQGFSGEDLSLSIETIALRSSATSGSGLGLLIVKGFTEALNGTVRLQNSSNGGTRFVVRLPSETATNIPLENE